MSVTAATLAYPSRIPKSYLDTLPTELLLIIKSGIVASDIRTHVCFYRSHPTIQALYERDKDEELFWKRTCWLAGIGLIRDETPDTVRWRDIALECIDVDGFCMNSHCGAVLLEQNAKGMAHAPLPIPCEAWPSAASELSYANRILGEIEFQSLEDRCLPRTLESDARLSFHPQEPDDVAFSNYGGPLAAAARRSKVEPYCLRNHPLVMRSFALFPPVQTLQMCALFQFAALSDPFRPSRITVWDLQAVLHEQLDEELGVSTLCELLEFAPDCLQLSANNGDEESVSKNLLAFHTLRGVFDSFRVVDLNLIACHVVGEIDILCDIVVDSRSNRQQVV